MNSLLRAHSCHLWRFRPSVCPQGAQQRQAELKPKAERGVSQREEGPRGGDRVLGRKAEAQRTVWGRVAPGKPGWGVGTSLGLEQGYQWELGPGKIPLPMVSEADGAGGGRWGVPLGGRAVASVHHGSSLPPSHSGTPPWDAHISAVFHRCPFTAATRIFKPKYTNFRSLEMIKFNTF